jgi:hypothetical protein
MKRKIFAIACGLLLIFAFGACKKKEEAAPPVVPQFGGGPQQQQGVPQGHQPLISVGETSILVPDSVKGKWKAVILKVENKTTKKTEELTVNLNSDVTLPNSNIKVSVGDFLPDFKMDGRTITSLSNELNNPAVRIIVFENDDEIFKGWLYSKFPSIHPFEHPQYGILLKNGVTKG